MFQALSGGLVVKIKLFYLCGLKILIPMVAGHEAVRYAGHTMCRLDAIDINIYLVHRKTQHRVLSQTRLLTCKASSAQCGLTVVLDC